MFLYITEHWCGCLIIQYPTDTGVPTYFPVETSWSEQGRVESVGSVGGHDHLDLAERVKAVHLVQQLSGEGNTWSNITINSFTGLLWLLE